MEARKRPVSHDHPTGHPSTPPIGLVTPWRAPALPVGVLIARPHLPVDIRRAAPYDTSTLKRNARRAEGPWGVASTTALTRRIDGRYQSYTTPHDRASPRQSLRREWVSMTAGASVTRSGSPWAPSCPDPAAKDPRGTARCELSTADTLGIHLPHSNVSRAPVSARDVMAGLERVGSGGRSTPRA